MEELETTQVEAAEAVETVEVIETVEAEVVEEQAVEDATYDPGARVEETQSYAEAEAVESELTAVMTEPEAADAEAANMAVMPASETESAAEAGVIAEIDESADMTSGSEPGDMAKPDEPVGQARDPLTGKGYGEQTQSPSGEAEADDLLMAEPLDESEAVQVQTAGLTGEAFEQEAQAADTEVDPSLIDGNETDYQVNEESGNISGAVGTQDGFNEDVTGELDPQRLGPDGLPQEELLPIGMGPNGAIIPGGGKLPNGKGGFPGGSSTNGGGPPVGNYGSGSKGNGGKKGKGKSGKVTYWGVNDGMHFEGSSNDSCEKETVRQSKRSEITNDGNVIIDCGDGTQYQLYWENGGDLEVSKRGMTLDGDTSMPYTGNWSGGEDPDPDTPIGGVDHEAGKIFPVVAGGGSDSGGKTPGDKDGDDDSGHFLGDPNLSGSDDYVPPPDDDIPYHDLQQLAKLGF